jgi:hypothetical protein
VQTNHTGRIPGIIDHQDIKYLLLEYLKKNKKKQKKQTKKQKNVLYKSCKVGYLGRFLWVIYKGLFD